MRRLFAFILLAALGLTAIGCGQGEVSNADQAAKMTALHDAEKDSRAKDGVQSE